MIICAFYECQQKIPKEEVVGCTKCKKAFHKNCFEKHNKEEHQEKAKPRELKLAEWEKIGAVKIGNKMYKP